MKLHASRGLIVEAPRRPGSPQPARPSSGRPCSRRSPLCTFTASRRRPLTDWGVSWSPVTRRSCGGVCSAVSQSLRPGVDRRRIQRTRAPRRCATLASPASIGDSTIAPAPLDVRRCHGERAKPVRRAAQLAPRQPPRCAQAVPELHRPGVEVPKGLPPQLKQVR